jgi:hypothetical protein
LRTKGLAGASAEFDRHADRFSRHTHHDSELSEQVGNRLDTPPLTKNYQSGEPAVRGTRCKRPTAPD